MKEQARDKEREIRCSKIERRRKERFACATRGLKTRERIAKVVKESFRVLGNKYDELK